jgi:hypothetical protein
VIQAPTAPVSLQYDHPIGFMMHHRTVVLAAADDLLRQAIGRDAHVFRAVIAKAYRHSFCLAQFGVDGAMDQFGPVVHVEQNDLMTLRKGRFGYALHRVKVLIGIYKDTELHGRSLLSISQLPGYHLITGKNEVHDLVVVLVLPDIHDRYVISLFMHFKHCFRRGIEILFYQIKDFHW